MWSLTRGDRIWSFIYRSRVLLQGWPVFFALVYTKLDNPNLQVHNDAHKAEQEATTIFVTEQKVNRMFQIKFPHPRDKCLSAVTFETP